MRLRVHHEFTCDLCGRHETQTYLVRSEDEPLRPNPPAGWRDIYGVTVCPTHRITADLRVWNDGGFARLWRPDIEL